MAPPRRAAPSDTTAPEETIASPITGEVVGTTDVFVPSRSEQNAAADRARGRTVVQVGLPGAVVIIGTWLARIIGVDLNPLPGVEDMPPEVTAAFIIVATAGLAFRMNPKNDGGDGT